MNIFAEPECDRPLGSRRTGIGISDGMAFGRQPAEDAMKRMLFADGGRTQTSVKQVCSPPQWGGGELRDSASRNIHTRQPNPRQKRFRTKGGRGDEALRIGDFLILKNAKHPIQRRRKADPEIVSPRRFFGYLLSAQKVTK